MTVGRDRGIAKAAILSLLLLGAAQTCGSNVAASAVTKSKSHHSSGTTATTAHHHSSHRTGSASHTRSATAAATAGRGHSLSRRHHRRGTTQPAASQLHPAGKHHGAKHPVAEGPVVEPSGYGSQSKIYSLYDQGVNARLIGDYHTAVSRLAEAIEMLKESRLSPTLETMAEFELGQAAESDNQPKVAINAYSRCVYLSPRYTDASLKLASLLLRTGQPALALVRARDAVQRNPNDASARMVLSLVLEKNGFAHDATAEHDRATQLLSGRGKVAEPAPRIESAPGTQPGVPPEEPESEMTDSPEKGVTYGSAPEPGNGSPSETIDAPSAESSNPAGTPATAGAPMIPPAPSIPIEAPTKPESPAGKSESKAPQH
ncbi:MAG TPA: hypothetical protein V6C69_18855 [Trichormus sp.]